jgi:two-component system LytT family response regulator
MNGSSDELVVLIVDDEKQAGLNLKSMLHEYVDPNINIAGIANSTYEAELQIARYNPDAVFLDIEMPKEDAFLFLSRVSPVNFDVIFVTAYSNYAVNAFKLNAVDYLLKPISILELRNAVDKLKKRQSVKKMMAEKNHPIAAPPAKPAEEPVNEKITLRGTAGVEIVEFKHICFVEAQSSYSKFVFTKDGILREITMSYPLSDYEDFLPSKQFFRIHRSYLINRHHVKDVANDDSCLVTMTGDFKLRVSRRRITALIDFLK